jgi:hypothetical protein
MDYQKKWLDDLKQGEWGEKIIAEFFEKRGYEILDFNKTGEYDILIKKDFEIRLEIKTDRWEFFNEKITNNIFLEVSCSGKPSGITNSKADFFIYFFPDWDIFYTISMSKARELLNYGIRKSYSGDGGRVIGYTINRFDFSDWFKIQEIIVDKNVDNF